MSQIEKPHVLAIDDDVLLREVLMTIFKLHGYRVTVAASGQQGLHFLVTATPLPDLILVDVQMPHMNGYQFVETLHANEQWRQIPVLLMSGQWRSTSNEWTLPDGVYGYVEKPFSIQDMVVMASNAIGLHTNR